jgi:hypothetical protein
VTDQEIVDLACSGRRPLRVSMSKDGVTFTVGTETHAITEDQAELLWRVLPLAGQLPVAV